MRRPSSAERRNVPRVHEPGGIKPRPESITTVAVGTSHRRDATRLWVEEPGRRPRRVVIPAQQIVCVGRSPRADVPVSDLEVSRTHAVLHFDGRHLTLVDNLSRNGTHLRGVRMRDEAVLRPGAPARIGDTVLVQAAHPHDRPPLATDDLLGSAMRDRARRLAAIELPLWIRSEPGCGQAELSRAIHDASRRAERPFVRVRCAWLAPGTLASELLGGGAPGAGEGLLRRAAGGTVLFEGIDDLDDEARGQLTRLLRERVMSSMGETHRRPLDVRVMVSGRAPTGPGAPTTTLAETLFRGVHHAALDVPPLRADPAAIVPLAARLLAAVGDTRSLGPGVRAALTAHGWPGNLDELCDALDFARSLAETDAVTVEDLPRSIRARTTAPAADPATPGGTLDGAVERSAVTLALWAMHGDAGAAAALLGISADEMRWTTARLGLDVV